MRIIAIGVALADATVFSMNQHFRFLVLGDVVASAEHLATGLDNGIAALASAFF